MNEEVISKIENAKEQGKKVGLVQGSWDMFHLGHLSYLQEAKKLCDFLVVGMDSDAKIKHRKGNHRPIIPEKERYQFIEKLNIADIIIIKQFPEEKWGLIKTVKPDVLVAIKENYKDEDIEKLKEYCSSISILPRQSTNSTSDIIRKVLIMNGIKIPQNNEELVKGKIEELKQKIGFDENTKEPIPMLLESLKNTTDPTSPVSACCFYNGKWHFGSNQIDQTLPLLDIENRTELFYDTVEHAEINLLKKLGDVEVLDTPIYTTLFPCDKCMKVLISKGVKEIYYLEDHLDRNWSKRSHALAEKKGIKTINLSKEETQKEEILPTAQDKTYKYIDPKNVRYQQQLEIMLEKEARDEDPLDPKIIDQEILFTTDYWYVSLNRFPYKEIKYQFLIASLNPIYNIDNMPIKMWQELKSIWNILINKYNLPGGALCYRFGDTTYSGASLKRLHAHLIVPKESNKTKFTIGGNKEISKKLILTQDKGNTNK